MSFNEIDDTLVDYFKQMLLEEEEQSSQVCEDNVQETSDTVLASSVDEFAIDTSSLVEETPVADDEPSIDVSSIEVQSDDAASNEPYVPAESDDSYFAPQMDEDSLSLSLAHFQQMANIDSGFSSDTTENLDDPEVHERVTSFNQDIEPKLNQETDTELSKAMPYAEPHPLEKLLESVDTKTEVETKTEVSEKTEVEQKVEVLEQVAPVQEQVVVKNDEKIADTQMAVENQDNVEPEEQWHNIELPKEFQALFFLVKGIRFAVPLVNLGGIFQSEKVTPLFGKPKWFMGIADIRGKKMNVVDTLKWVKSDAPDTDNYEYKITLDKTLWSIGCDELEGNRILSNDSVTWRQQAGNRPWLAGIVKKEMCALLHVEELIKMFEKGVNLKDLEQQMSE